MYPHLADYFSFLEYDNAKIGGGVGNLVNMVKAFAGAGVVNNIIALFDNDTAAEAAIGNIGKINLPENIRILKLPELDILKNYPTIGPSGNVMLNVNGIAASIELYFGEDVLKVAENDFAPIQWTGYDAGVKKYQGEVTEKKLLQTRFKEKLAIAKLGNNSSFDSTWDSIRSILKLILFAFEDRNKKNICDFAKDYYAR